MHGTLGFAGWQWLFLVEGLPVVLVGISVLWLLPDRPDDAAWLTDDDRRIVRERLEAERKPKEVRLLSAALKDLRVWMLAGVQFGFLVGSYGIVIFLPQMLKDNGHGSAVEIGFINSACYACASVGMILWARHVQHGGGKIANLTLACALAAVGFLGAGLSSESYLVSTLWVTVALIGINGARAIFWTIPPRFLSGIAAAGGLAFINSFGTAGGQVGPTVMGWLRETTGSYSAGLLAMSVFLVLAAGLAWSLRRVVRAGQDKAAADL
jgi:MFS transporter, ACS family, tartrate transporter